jgi:hypothetical protein
VPASPLIAAVATAVTKSVRARLMMLFSTVSTVT